jgi:hypothetical protein
VFLSYRRADAAGHAGRLYDVLRQRLGGRAVFMDVAGMDPGTDFRERIATELDRCAVCVALVGPSWEGPLPGGGRRIDDQDDFVRREVATALARDMPLIPVLVQRAQLPAPDQLPEEVRGLAYRHALELDDTRWDYDTKRLCAAIQAVRGAPSRRRSRWIVAVATLVTVLAIGVWWWWLRPPAPTVQFAGPTAVLACHSHSWVVEVEHAARAVWRTSDPPGWEEPSRHESLTLAFTDATTIRTEWIEYEATGPGGTTTERYTIEVQPDSRVEYIRSDEECYAVAEDADS